MTAYFTHIGTAHNKEKNRVVNYEGRHDHLAKPKALAGVGKKKQPASDTLVELVDTFAEKCNYNKGTGILVDGHFRKGIRFEYETGECKHEGFAVKKPYRMDMQGFVDDAGYRANVALQWGKGNDGTNGGSAGAVLVECGVDFKRGDLLAGMIRSIRNKAKVYLSKTKQVEADQVAGTSAQEGAAVWYSSAPQPATEV